MVLLAKHVMHPTICFHRDDSTESSPLHVARTTTEDNNQVKLNLKSLSCAKASDIFDYCHIADLSDSCLTSLYMFRRGL